jgi:hypothetical protein
MKLWFSTANALQHSRCCEIGAPFDYAQDKPSGLKMTMNSKRETYHTLFLKTSLKKNFMT